MWRFGTLVAGLLMVGLATAAPPIATRVLTHPSCPTVAELDRLNLQLAWRQQLPCESSRDGIAVIQQNDTQLFVQLRDGVIIAMDAETGIVDWTLRLGKDYPVVRRLGFGPQLVLALDDNRLIALDKKTGVQRWTIQLPDVPICPPTVGELLLYLSFSNGRFITYALPETTEKALSLDRKQRTELSRELAKIRATIDQVAPLAPTGVNLRSPGVEAAGGRSATSTTITARGATSSTISPRAASSSMALHRAASYVTKDATAAEVKQLTAEPFYLSSRSPGFRVEHPVIVSSVGILLSGYGRDTLTLRRDLDHPTYEFRTPAPLSMPPVQYDTMAYFACDDGGVFACNLAVGQLLWQSTLPSPMKEPMIATDRALFGATQADGITMIDRFTGQSVWIQPAGQKILAVNQSYVYAVDRLGRLIVLDRATGTAITECDLANYNVTFVNGRTDRIFMAANDGSLICLHDRNQVTPWVHDNVPQAPIRPLVSSSTKAK